MIFMTRTRVWDRVCAVSGWTVSAGWSTFEVSFDDLLHPEVPDHETLDKANLYSLEFTFEGSGEFDVWIDDISFVACATL